MLKEEYETKRLSFEEKKTFCKNLSHEYDKLTEVACQAQSTLDELELFIGNPFHIDPNTAKTKAQADIDLQVTNLKMKVNRNQYTTHSDLLVDLQREVTSLSCQIKELEQQELKIESKIKRTLLANATYAQKQKFEHLQELEQLGKDLSHGSLDPPPEVKNLIEYRRICMKFDEKLLIPFKAKILMGQPLSDWDLDQLKIQQNGLDERRKKHKKPRYRKTLQRPPPQQSSPKQKQATPQRPKGILKKVTFVEEEQKSPPPKPVQSQFQQEILPKPPSLSYLLGKKHPGFMPKKVQVTPQPKEIALPPSLNKTSIFDIIEEEEKSKKPLLIHVEDQEEKPQGLIPDHAEDQKELPPELQALINENIHLQEFFFDSPLKIEQFEESIPEHLKAALLFIDEDSTVPDSNPDQDEVQQEDVVQQENVVQQEEAVQQEDAEISSEFTTFRTTIEESNQRVISQAVNHIEPLHPNIVRKFFMDDQRLASIIQIEDFKDQEAAFQWQKDLGPRIQDQGSDKTKEPVTELLTEVFKRVNTFPPPVQMQLGRFLHQILVLSHRHDSQQALSFATDTLKLLGFESSVITNQLRTFSFKHLVFDQNSIRLPTETISIFLDEIMIRANTPSSNSAQWIEDKIIALTTYFLLTRITLLNFWDLQVFESQKEQVLSRERILALHDLASRVLQPSILQVNIPYEKVRAISISVMNLFYAYYTDQLIFMEKLIDDQQPPVHSILKLLNVIELEKDSTLMILIDNTSAAQSFRDAFFLGFHDFQMLPTFVRMIEQHIEVYVIPIEVDPPDEIMNQIKRLVPNFQQEDWTVFEHKLFSFCQLPNLLQKDFIINYADSSKQLHEIWPKELTEDTMDIEIKKIQNYNNNKRSFNQGDFKYQVTDKKHFTKIYTYPKQIHTEVDYKRVEELQQINQKKVRQPCLDLQEQQVRGRPQPSQLRESSKGKHKERETSSNRVKEMLSSAISMVTGAWRQPS
ncbi:UNKNOWN [Stylonychia lemnae]|uniref:Uncharacterized protein n=1 Tax=Stylonychia lemnae TaxID=5949 RepID=A0A078B0B1_STYLE|nr:UNKNOWN [Stylonychia lemnae]|eukprot:CDW87939.1 UNKNOWN [Stylonychia lemnae]